MLKKVLKDNAVFLAPMLLLGLAGTCTLITSDKGVLVLWLNDTLSFTAFQFFKYATLIAEDWMVIAIGLLVALFSIKYALIYFFNYLFAGLVAQILKKLVFAGKMRPVLYYSDIDFTFANEVKLHAMHSFPSGHTTVAFAMMLSLCYMVQNKLLKMVLLVIAVIVGLSRVTLYQHFLEDVVAGAMIGTFCALLGIIIWDNHSFFRNRASLNQGIIKMLGKSNA